MILGPAEIEHDRKRINMLIKRVKDSAMPEAKKKELLERLNSLQPKEPTSEHHPKCKCGNCDHNYGYASEDKQLVIDPAIEEIQNNFSNPIIPPRIMNSKVTAFVVIGVGIALTIIGIRMMRKQKAAAPAAA